jgi:hypothetical protein
MPQTRKSEHKMLSNPDEVRHFPHGRVEVVNIGGGTVGRLILEPGWRWSKDVKPLVRTDSCEAPHFQFQVSGKLGIRMDDGTEIIGGPGDVAIVPPGHDAWVIGDEPVVLIDWHGATKYAVGA